MLSLRNCFLALMAFVSTGALAGDMIEIDDAAPVGSITVREILSAPVFQNAESREQILRSARAALLHAEFESEKLRGDVMSAMSAIEVAAVHGEEALENEAELVEAGEAKEPVAASSLPSHSVDAIAFSEAVSVQSGKLDRLPFNRILDLQVGVGIMDMVHLCIEAHTGTGLVIEGCASVALFVASLSGALKYRWDVVLHQTAGGKIHQLSVGPGLGIRRAKGCLFSCTDGWMVSAMASLEYVYWITRHFGLTAQLDAGAEYAFGWTGSSTNGQVIPFGRLSIGFAF